jgi:thiamine kinase-like enzyme
MSLLTLHDTASYLIEAGLLLPSDVVDHDVRIGDVSRRNRNFTVVASTGVSYFVKQGGDALSGRTVQNEAAFYQYARDNSKIFSITKFLPVFRNHDQRRGVMVTEWLPIAKNYRHPVTERPLGASKHAASMLGTALGTLHCIPYDLEFNSPWFREQELVLSHILSILSIHRPSLSVLREASGGQLQLVRMVQHLPEFGNRLDELRSKWKAESIIHADLKWDNVLLLKVDDSTSGSSLRIVDWELATVGDPSWDIATVLGEYLSLWVMSVPEYGRASIESAAVPLASLQPSIRSFWHAYSRAASCTASITQRLRRSIEFVPARLLQIVFEHSQAATRLTRNEVLLVQLSLNLTQDADSAVRALLGLGDAWEAGEQ